MTESDTTGSPGTPGHLWLVGLLATLWNAMGVWDFYATQTKHEAYMEAFTQPQLDFFYGLPTWAVAAWGTAVIGALLGSLLLLLRKRLAAPLFVLSFVGMMVSFVHNFVLSNAMDEEVMGTPGVLGFTAVLIVVGVLLIVYSRAMSRSGVLD